MRFETVLRGGTVVDGTGSPPRTASVGIVEGSIAEVGVIPLGAAEREIDASDSIIAPGFIDIHTHSDFTVTE